MAFELKPVRDYRAARYPSSDEPHRRWPTLARAFALSVIFAAILVVVYAVLGEPQPPGRIRTVGDLLPKALVPSPEPPDYGITGGVSVEVRPSHVTPPAKRRR